MVATANKKKSISMCERYALDVVTGKQVAGEFIKKAAARFLKDLKRKDIYFDEKEAMKFINFVERYCMLWEDEWRGKPMVVKPWMAFIFMQIFGWFVKETGKRRIRKVFVEVAKKNAKSSLGAMLANFHLFADHRIQTPNVYVGANNEDQAKICVNITGKIIEQSPELYKFVDHKVVELFRYKEKIVNILHRERDGFIKAMSKEPAKTDTAQSGTKHGINPSLAIIDEYAMADSDNFLNTMESAMAARGEPLIFCITTAGYKQSGPCFLKLRKTGIEINEGILEDDSYLAFIWEPDEGDDINDPKTWLKSNPNIGVSVSPIFLKARLQAAKNEGGTKEVDVKTYNFNMWVDSPEVWVSSDTWKTNYHKSKESELDARECFGGLEIVSGLDLNAFLLYFPRFKKDVNAVKCFFWMAAGRVIDNKMKMDCTRWVEQGFIHTTPGNVIDNETIYNQILEDKQRYNLHSLAFNINLLNHDILQGLVRAGIECNPISQGYRGISEPTLAWEELLTSGSIEHFNNPVLAWMNSNCLINRKDNDVKVMKSNGRVAGISAAIHALAQFKTIEALGQNDKVLQSW